MTSSAQLAYRFNGFRLDPVRRLLFSADGLPIPLKPKVFATLLYLVERPGELVAKEALLAAVWPHVVVEENNLNKAISTLRQVLGETRDSHRFIVTEPGRGYRFVASVEALPSVAAEPLPMRVDSAATPGTPSTVESSRPRWMLVAAALAAVGVLGAIAAYWLSTPRAEPAPNVIAAAAPPASSIAVLPFANLSPDPGDAYFAVGIHEEIVNQLTKLGGLHVASRTSVQRYAGMQKSTPEITRELNVETVLDGSVRYADGRVLVTVHLSDGATNATLWSESYEHAFSDIFEIQSDIALKVAQALKAELLPGERARVARAPTSSLPAYALYLQAVTRQQRATREETLLAIGDAEEALELDRDFAAAWVLDSNLHTVAQFFDPEHAAEHRSQGEEAARRALALDPERGEAHAALGFALTMLQDWTGGEAAFREALRRKVPLGEMAAYAALQLAVANYPYARAVLEEARRVNPEDSAALRGLITANAALGDWELAHAQYDSGTRLFAPWPEGDTLMMHLEVGRNELEHARAIPAAGPINAAMIATLGDPPTALRELHRLYAATVAGNPVNRRNVGLWAGYFGDAALALDAMHSAVAEQPGQVVYLWLPQLMEMRQLPAFKAFLREIGIVAYWQEYGWPAICRPVANGDFTCD
jgi:TolB-like protein/DNA-binding winged helix-turn-helix (wHTH) protein